MQVFGKDFMYWLLPTRPDNLSLYQGPKFVPAPSKQEIKDFEANFNDD